MEVELKVRPRLASGLYTGIPASGAWGKRREKLVEEPVDDL